MKERLKNNHSNLLIVVFFMLGCMAFALIYSTFFTLYLKNNQSVILAQHETTQTLIDKGKVYSDVKEVIEKYSPEDVTTLNTNEETKEEKLTETKEIALNMKSSVDKHLLSVKQAKEQKEKEKQEALRKQREAEEKAKKESEVKKARNATSQPTKAGGMSITAYERDLLERLVEAEAGGEPYEGKLAVATVVINRVKSSQFPNSIHGVIYQKNQFSPVANGAINRKASADSKKAVRQVIDEGYRSFGSDVVYFLSPKIATSKWIINNRTFVKAIGNHHFYK